jgi:hypothetical protein
MALVSHPLHGDNDACLVRNLSANGALLLSSPPLSPGDTCLLVLTAPGLMGEELEARVSRAGTTSDGSAWAAVEFFDVTDVKLERLRRVVDLEQVLANAPAVLVVDGLYVTLQIIADLLAHHSRRTHLADTSLAAINWLNERNRHIALALIGNNIRGTTQAELLDYIGETYPHIHRVRMDQTPTDAQLCHLLDRTEADVTEHPPWSLDSSV